MDEQSPLPPSATRRPTRGKAAARAKLPGPAKTAAYILDHQIGFILRQAYQKHALLFVECFGEDFTPTQWAAVAYCAMKVSEIVSRLERVAKAVFSGVPEEF